MSSITIVERDTGKHIEISDGMSVEIRLPDHVSNKARVMQGEFIKSHHPWAEARIYGKSVDLTGKSLYLESGDQSVLNDLKPVTCWICTDPIVGSAKDTVATCMCPSLHRFVCEEHAPYCEDYGHEAISLSPWERK